MLIISLAIEQGDQLWQAESASVPTNLHGSEVGFSHILLKSSCGETRDGTQGRRREKRQALQRPPLSREPLPPSMILSLQ